MRNKLTGFLLGAAALLAPFTYGSAHQYDDNVDDIPDATEPNDSVQDLIMTLSDSDEGNPPSFFNRIIPPSPQAAALAQYAEYPVSHTTGIPDISVPLYEIDLGGYKLPISVSYHASGSKPDQLPTCVGLGWVLNAGGAISRTILGKPDMYHATASQTDYRYFDRDNFVALLNAVKDNTGDIDPAHLTSIIGDSPEWDTESDRYTFNVAGKSGVFRYSHKDRQYIVLNNSNDEVSSFGKSGSGSLTFQIRGTDGITYDFEKEENTGVTDYFNEKPFTSTWYVTQITTPWGNISFTYEDAKAVDVHCQSIIANSGPIRKVEEILSTGGNATGYTMKDEYRIDFSESKYTLSYGQKLLKKIEWDGNRIEFEYIDEHPSNTLQRLTCMKVYNSAGQVRKTVTFDNTDNWPTNSSLTGRRLLKSISDSEQGTWKFDYNKKTELPALSETMGSPACQSDLWGYMNSTRRSTERDAFTEGQIDWLMRGVDDYAYFTTTDIAACNAGSRDRSPNLACTLAGVLEKITFPTGGYLQYEYELNRLGSRLCGGLRVKSVTSYEGSSSNGRKTSYGYSSKSLSTEDPEMLMNYYTHVQIRRSPSSPTPPELGNPAPYHYRTCSVFPINPVTAQGSHVVYNAVTETRCDGSRIEYIYDEEELAELFGVSSDKYTHPSLYQQSVWDFGNREPLLKSRTVFDAAGNTVLSEEYEYLKKQRKSFSTGLRTACPYSEYEVPQDPMYPVYGVTTQNAAHFGMVQYTPSTAFSRVCLLSKKTVTDPSGFSTVTDYTYDPEYRTMSPRTVTLQGSANDPLRTEYTYQFDYSDEISKDMVETIQTDYPVETSRYTGTSLLSKTKTGYGLYNGMYYAVSDSTWSLPTGTAPGGKVKLAEREKVGSYNSKGRPLSIKVNETDLHSFTWDKTGTLLLTSTAPGSLATAYTHRALFGLESVKLPNGYQTKYLYNDAGMLSSISDGSGPVESYNYSISGHPTMNTDGNSVAKYVWRGTSTTNRVLTKQYYSPLGRKTTFIQGGMNTSKELLFSTYAYDDLGRPVESILPGAGGKEAVFKPYNDVVGFSKATYGEEYTCSQTTLDALDRPVKVTTPGDAWRSVWKAKTTEYVTNQSSSVRLYTAPLTSTSLSCRSYYSAKTLQGVRTVDEDGKEMTVYTDRLGRKVLERRGPESKKGQNDTYFVYNALGQLRFVLSPSYQESANLTEYAYEYRYDQHGNVVYKAIPGAGYTEYWYDRAGRLAYMQDANLRASSLYRFFLYDKAGRQVIQGVCKTCTLDETVNFATYTGGTSGFMSTGYTLANASRIQQATLETVAFFDAYTFKTNLDTHLNVTGTASAKGLQTGAVVYASDGSKSVSAIYYDAKGRVTETRVLTHFGTKRTTTTSYNYAGQPLKTTFTEGTVNLITENTYDASSGLLTATDVTVNGTKQCVSKVTYDDLGRIKSVKRGNDTNSDGTVSYTYNIHGQTKSITGPGFTQNLYYADGNGNKLYNGSVSSMTWKMGSDATIRGYKYSYNDYSWLTAADYGETAALTSNKDRYTEKMTSFTRNGGIKGLQRYGKQASGTYGFIDNLSIGYSGNRIAGVSDGAPVVTQNGSMDFPGGTTSAAFSYNAFGALTADPSRGITSITYDNFGNPTQIQFSNGRDIENVYSASGEKLKTLYMVGVLTSVDAASPFDLEMEPESAATEGSLDTQALVAQSTISYHGPIIYRNNAVDKVLFQGGYATITGSTVTFHYYTKDYLGNNRAVINGSTGAIEQTVAYYPFGAVIADLGTPTTGQPYKFGGKELLTTNGLNEYDFGARNYYPAVPSFAKPDRKAEKYYWLSPYLFCANNPVNNIDPTGMDTWKLDSDGHLVSHEEHTDYDEIVVTYDDDRDDVSWQGEYGSISKQSNIKRSDENGDSVLILNNDEDGTGLFEMLAKACGIEWQHLKTGDGVENSVNYVSTSHTSGEDGSAFNIIMDRLSVDGVLVKRIREANHSHPGNRMYPSGMEINDKEGDIFFASWLDHLAGYKIWYNIFTPQNGKYTEYNAHSELIDFISKYPGMWND